MATVLEAFVVTLGLDGKNFASGIGKAKQGERELDEIQRRRDAAEKKRQQEQAKAVRQTSDNYRRLRNDALALAAVFTAGVGIKSFITNTIDSAANLGYLSQNLGMSTERIKAFQLASERAGGSQEGLISQLKESADSIAQLNSGLGPNEGIQWFFRLGGSSKDLRDGNSYLLARSKLIADIFKTDPTRAATIAKQLGISEDQFNFLKQGPEAVEKLIAAQEKHAAITVKDAESALKLKNQLLDLRDELQLTATRIVIQLMPALERLFARLEKGAEWVNEHKEDIAKWVDTSVTAITYFVHWVDAAAESVGGWKNVLIGLIGLKFAGTILQLTAIATQLASIAGAAPGVGTALGLIGKAGAVGLAGAAGYAAGSYAYDNFLSDETKDKVGELVARTLASFGNEEAARAVNTNTGRNDYYVPPSPAKPSTPAAKPRTTSPVPSNAKEILEDLEIQYGLPAGVLDRVWMTESQRSNPKFLKSPVGAEGPFGFMPRTAKEYGLDNPYNFTDSADAAARKYRDLLKQYGGDLNMAAAAYNFGQGNLERTGLAGAPKETRDYVQKVAGGLQSAAAPLPRAQGMGGNSTTSVNIDQITVNTKATDAQGIAKDIKPAVERYTFTDNANTGMIQ